MNRHPWLSVLIPVFNGEKYLAEALDSIIIQADENIECIVVDSDSNDATLSILKSYQNKLPLKILQLSKESNWVFKTNYALSCAQGSYVCFLHHDDIWLKNRLRVMKLLVDQFSESVLFLHPSYFIDQAGKNLGLWSSPLPAYPIRIKPSLMIELLLIQNFISIPSPIFKRDIALSVNGMDNSLWYTADWDFWLKIAA